MIINSYKNRKIDYTKKIYVYRNLNCKSEEERYSVMQNGLVVAHCDEIYLEEVDFVIRKAGKRLARCSGKRNVHAFIKGFIINKPIKTKFFTPIRYNPFNEYGFFSNENNQELKKASTVILKKSAIIAYNPIFKLNFENFL